MGVEPEDSPLCPLCGSSTIKKIARRGSNAGGTFFGCSRYPGCKGIVAGGGSQSDSLAPSGVDDDETAQLSEPQESPSCPDCGAVMVLKVARKGRNSGNQFWGCPKWPSCKGVASHAKATPIAKKNTRRKVELRDGTTERDRWIIRYTAGGASLRTLSYPAGLSERLAALWIAREDVDSAHVVDPPTLRTLGVVRKILQRGSTPPVPPAVEEAILRSDARGLELEPSLLPGDLSWFIEEPPKPPDDLDVLPFATSQRPCGEDLPFGSDEERMFVAWLERELGLGASAWFTPQVPLHQIAHASGYSADGITRVDFLATAPWLPKLIVEIDGEQHRDAIAVDRRADELAERLDIQVIRVPAREIREGAGPNLEAVAAWWSNPHDALAGNDKALFLGPTQVHRIALGLIEACEAGFLSGEVWSVRLHDTLGKSGGWLAPYLDMIWAVDQLWGGGIVSPMRVEIDGGEQQWSYVQTGSGFELAEHLGTPVDLELFAEIDQLPTADLPPRRKGVPRIVLRSCNPLVGVLDGRGDGVTRRVRPTQRGDDMRVPLEVLLQGVFAKKAFREGQYEAISEILAGQDCTVLLPTGGGKSLIYQLAGLCLPGRTIVVAPLVSLIEDQRDGMKANGIDRVVCLTSHELQSAGSDELHESVAQGDALFVLMAPERLQRRKFREALQRLTTRVPINFAALDEAHCVSDWGHDFRTPYLLVGRTLRECCGRGEGGGTLPLLALTGTASRAVLRDVLAQLEFGASSTGTIIKPRTFDRPELHFRAVRALPSEAIGRLQGELEGLADRAGMTPGQFFRSRGTKTKSGLVFCVTVGGGFGVTSAADAGLSVLGARPNIYSGKPPVGKDPQEWEVEKRENARRFKDNEDVALVSTSAFGMGIDKPNIRWVVHFGMPSSIEDYYQQVGRAGRDRRESNCVLILIEYDGERDRALLAEDVSLLEMRDRVRQIGRTVGDDVTTALYFHLGSFKGIEVEVQRLMAVVDELEPGPERRDVEIPRADGDGREQALARLIRLGVVTDYSIPRERSFDVVVAPLNSDTVVKSLAEYVERSQPGRSTTMIEQLGDQSGLTMREVIENCARLLVGFVYETIERSRRRSIREMWLAAREAAQVPDEGAAEELLRRRILDYLTEGDISPILESLAGDPEFKIDAWCEVLDDLYDDATAQEMRGATARLLTADPNHTGLLLARACSESLTSDRDLQDVQGNLESMFASAKDRFGLNEATLIDLAKWMVRWAARRDHDVLATFEIAIARAGLVQHVRRLPDLTSARLNDEPSGALLINHWWLELNEVATWLQGETSIDTRLDEQGPPESRENERSQDG